MTLVSLVLMFAEPALACPVGLTDGLPHRLGEIVLMLVFVSLGMLIVLVPACAVLLVLKGLAYKIPLKRWAFRDLVRANAYALLIAVAIGVAYFALDQFVTEPAREVAASGPAADGAKMAPESMAEMLPKPLEGAALLRAQAISGGMFVVFFIAFYLTERKLFAKYFEGKIPLRGQIYLVTANIVSACVLWLVVSMYTTASCGSISSGNLKKVTVEELKLDGKDTSPP